MRNPLYCPNDDADEPGPLLELKTRLVLYTDVPPGPITARRVYDLYMSRFGDCVTAYRSTAFASGAEAFTQEARTHFETVELPELRNEEHWGYFFGSEQSAEPRVFMFHGARPVSEEGRASVFRFDFEWDFDPIRLRDFTLEVLGAVECVCGTAGYVLCPDSGDYAGPAADKMFAWAMRYWGAEAQDLDSTVEHALIGFPCISWLTIIGRALRAKAPAAVEQARAVAFASFESQSHVVIQAEQRPRLIDRNQREPLGNYPAVAEALLPLQVEAHTAFDGDRWDDDKTMSYLRRFTHPNEV